MRAFSVHRLGNRRADERAVEMMSCLLTELPFTTRGSGHFRGKAARKRIWRDCRAIYVCALLLAGVCFLPSQADAADLDHTSAGAAKKLPLAETDRVYLANIEQR